jgi:hypothetical protein
MNLPEDLGETNGHVPSAAAGGVSMSADDVETPLQPVAGGEAAVGVAGAGVGGAGAVAGHHRPRSPPGQAQQIQFGAALGEPLVGEGVAELVGVQAGQPGLPTAAFEHADQAPGGESSP